MAIRSALNRIDPGPPIAETPFSTIAPPGSVALKSAADPEVDCVDAAVTRSRSELAVRDCVTAREGSGRQARSRTWPANGRFRHRSAVRRAETDSRRRCVNATANWEGGGIVQK